MTLASILNDHEAVWIRATRHPFLDGVRDGSLPEPAFDVWLGQDHLFVADLLWFQARLLGRAPRSAQPVLVGGAAALVEELAWFERHAVARRIELDATPRAETQAYRRLLERLDASEFTVALTALWAIE